MEGIPSLTRDTQMVASGNNIFVVWYNQNINNGIFLAKSSDGGRTFGAPINLNDFNNAEFSQIAVNNDKIYVIWAEQFLDNKEVFLRYSIDGGESFGSKINLSNDDSEKIIISKLNHYFSFNIIHKKKIIYILQQFSCSRVNKF